MFNEKLIYEEHDLYLFLCSSFGMRIIFALSFALLLVFWINSYLFIVNLFYVCRRVAQELGVHLGEEVGYAIRFEDRSSNKTSIK